MTRRQQAGAGGLVILLIVGAYIVGFIGWASPQIAKDTCTVSNAKCPHDTIGLGVWPNMPSSSTCPIAAQVPDSCEFLGNMTQRGILIDTSSTPISVALTISLVVGSANPSAQLQLQYANYSSVTGLNTTLFTNIGNALNVASGSICAVFQPCFSPPSALPVQPLGNGDACGVLTQISECFVFRVVGENGNGAGDNPRFSYVEILLSTSSVNSVVTVAVTNNSTSAFTWVAYTVLKSPAPYTANIQWIASNFSNTIPTCGIVGGVLNDCEQHGFSQAIIPANSFLVSKTVTYPHAFTGSISVVIALGKVTAGIIGQSGFPLGAIDMFRTQIVTV